VEDIAAQINNMWKSNNPDFEQTLDDWLRRLKEGEKLIRQARSQFHQWDPLRVYVSVTKAKSSLFSLRFFGQEVAELVVKDRNVTLKLRKQHNKNNMKWFESATRGTTLSPVGKSRTGMNYRGQLPFSEMVAKCQMEGDDILVGYNEGGASAMRSSTPTDIRERLYKWDFKEDPIGNKNLKNWMSGNEFLKIVSEKLPDFVGYHREILTDVRKTFQ